jgi:hypothetical protein
MAAMDYTRAESIEDQKAEIDARIDDLREYRKLIYNEKQLEAIDQQIYELLLQKDNVS